MLHIGWEIQTALLCDFVSTKSERRTDRANQDAVVKTIQTADKSRQPGRYRGGHNAVGTVFDGDFFETYACN